MAQRKAVACAAMVAAQLAVAALALPSTTDRQAAPARRLAHLHARHHVQALSNEGDDVDHPAWCKSMDGDFNPDSDFYSRWGEFDFTVAQGMGLFSHSRLDRDPD